MNIKELREKYPLMFPPEEDRYTPISLFGVECGSGWDKIIETVFRLFYAPYQNALDSLDYWKKLKERGGSEFTPLEKVEEYIIQDETRVEQEKEKIPVIQQVKEKFGTLRIYCDYNSDYVRGIVDMAECMSAFTCEKCGNQGKTYTVDWYQTLCKEHAAEKYGKALLENHDTEDAENEEQ